MGEGREGVCEWLVRWRDGGWRRGRGEKERDRRRRKEEGGQGSARRMGEWLVMGHGGQKGEKGWKISRRKEGGKGGEEREREREREREIWRGGEVEGRMIER